MISNKTIFNSDWNNVSLEEMGEFSRGRSKHRPRDAKELFGGKYPFIQTGDIKEANLHIDRFSRTYSEFGLSQSKLWQKNTLCITIAANIAETAILKFDACFPDSVVGFRSYEDKSDVYFMHYLFCFIKKKIQKATSGSVQDNINLAFLKKLRLQIPSLAEQKKIATILMNIDNKIELNNEINKTLEEMAQTLFKRWFVDFEFPNEDEEAYKSSGGEMVESELGMIPKGWKVKCLYELGKIITGKTPSTKTVENYGNEYNFITPVDMKREIYVISSQRKLSRIGYNKVRKILIPQNSIGVTCIGSNLGEVYINAKESFTNQQINSLILENEYYIPYVYIVLKNMKKDFLNIAGGSAVPIINKNSFSEIKIIEPDDEILNNYCSTIMNMFEKIKENLIENESLIELRDSLLPKLMSGEIRVEDIEVNL